jgi:ABC-type uncharacterized transport system permease subunit
MYDIVAGFAMLLAVMFIAGAIAAATGHIPTDAANHVTSPDRAASIGFDIAVLVALVAHEIGPALVGRR